MEKIQVQQGIIVDVKLQHQTLLLTLTDRIFHLPKETIIIDNSSGELVALEDIKAGNYCRIYSFNGQYVCAVNERDAFYGVIFGAYNVEKSMIGDQLFMRHHESTIHYGAPLENAVHMLAFCKILTRSIPPQGTPMAIYIFKS